MLLCFLHISQWSSVLNWFCFTGSMISAVHPEHLSHETQVLFRMSRLKYSAKSWAKVVPDNVGKNHRWCMFSQKAQPLIKFRRRFLFSHTLLSLSECKSRLEIEFYVYWMVLMGYSNCFDDQESAVNTKIDTKSKAEQNLSWHCNPSLCANIITLQLHVALNVQML